MLIQYEPITVTVLCHDERSGVSEVFMGKKLEYVVIKDNKTSKGKIPVGRLNSLDFFYNTHNFSNKPNIFINEYKIKVDIQGRVKCVDGVKDSITFLELGITDNFKCTILD